MEKIREIHNLSLKILEEIGIYFESEDVLNKLADEGIRVSEKRAYFSSNDIFNWMSYAPKTVELKSRSSFNDICIGDNNIEFMAGYGAATIYSDCIYRQTDENDYVKLLKLIQSCDVFNVNGGILAEISGKGRNRNLKMMYNMVKYTDKCLMSASTDKEEAEDSIKILKMIFGNDDLKENCRMMALVNSTSPLQYDKNSLEIMEVFSRNNQPVIITPAAMVGSTGPISIKGTIAMSNAEILAGIVTAQIQRKGAPVIYGFQTSGTDMRTGAVALGDPVTSIFIKYGSELAKFYELPSRGGGSNTDADCCGIQSSYEGMMALYSSVQSGMNLIIHSAGMLSGNGVVSFEKFIVDIEKIRMIKYFNKDIDLGGTDSDFEEIKNNYEKKEFLTSENTFKNCREILFRPDISSRSFISSVAETENMTQKNIEQKINSLLGSYTEPYIDKSVLENIEKMFI